MVKQLLLQMLEQNRATSRSLDRVDDANASLRLNDKAASIGFIYRHIGETINLFAQFLGTPTDVVNTTIGKTDEGQGRDVQHSRQLIARGYDVLNELVERS